MELAKGVRDFTPEEMQRRTYVLDRIREQFRLHGFTPLETPIIERLDTLTAKMEGSDNTDVAKEIFKLTDQGNRELGLRFDLTVPVARYVAMHKELKLPFRRYEIGKVYRDGPIKLGRYREFVQCDADIIGAKSVLADAECLLIAIGVFDALDIPATIHVNSRAVLAAICEKLEIADATSVMITIDKLEKIGKHGVEKELTEKGVSHEKQHALLDLLLTEGTNAGKLAYLEKTIGPEPLKELRELFTYVPDVTFTPSLARGLAYYTGIVFEAFAQDSAIKSSIMGGGRYDNLIGVLTGGESHPAVGVSFGIEPICEVLKERTSENEVSTTRALIIAIGETHERCVKTMQSLRAHDIPCIMDISNRNVTKNFDYATKLHIPYAVIIGEKDLAQHLITVKDLTTGDEKKLAADDLDALVMELELR